MPDKNQVLVIEQLNMFTFLFFFIFPKTFFKSCHYIHTSKFFDFFYSKISFIERKTQENFKRIVYTDFSGSFPEIKTETGLYVNNALYIKNSSNFFIRLALTFCGDEKYSLAIKKELYDRYTGGRVKTFIFLKKISDLYECICFLPIDGEDIISLLSEKNKPANYIFIPWSYSFFLTLFGFFKSVSAVISYPFILFYLSVKILFNGLSFDKSPKKTYNYGIDSYAYGIHWVRPYHEFFIYNEKDFHPSKILHVFRSSLTDSRTKKLYEKYDIPYTCATEQKVPVKFYISRIIKDLFLVQLKEYFLNLPKNNHKWFFLSSCISTISSTINCEILYSWYDIRVFISRDDYAPIHVTRTLVARKHQNYSVGSMHGDYITPGSEASTDLLYDKYAIYGNFYAELNKAGHTLCHPEIIGAGMYGLDKTYEYAEKKYFPKKYAEIKKSHKFILIVGSSITDGIETCFTKEFLIKFLDDVLTITEEYTDYYRIIKPRENEFSDPDIQEILKGHERVIIDTDLWMYKLILVPDLTIIIGLTTVGLESIMAGKKAIYYDIYGYPKPNYSEYSPMLISYTFDDLKKNVGYILKEGRYVDQKTLDFIRSHHGYRFDGHVTERFRQMCRSLISDK